MAVHPVQASPAVAEQAFTFLLARGFTLHERWVTGGESFRDGWRLTYAGRSIQVVVQYMDVQFEVHFVRSDLDVSYLELDRDLFGRRSGFHGDMFPPDKLEAAIRKIAKDIQENYSGTLLGDELEWQKIERLKATPPKPHRLP